MSSHVIKIKAVKEMKCYKEVLDQLSNFIQTVSSVTYKDIFRTHTIQIKMTRIVNGFMNLYHLDTDCITIEVINNFRYITL